MHRLATLPQSERRRLVADFLDDAFSGLHANPEFVTLMRSAMPELPDDPTPDQVEAWMELAELCQNADFRTALRRTAEDQAEEPPRHDISGLHDGLDQVMRERIDEAVSAGILQAAARTAPPTVSLGSLYADALERADDGDLRRWLLARLRTTAHPHAERYWKTAGDDQRMARVADTRPPFTAGSPPLSATSDDVEQPAPPRGRARSLLTRPRRHAGDTDDVDHVVVKMRASWWSITATASAADCCPSRTLG